MARTSEEPKLTLPAGHPQAGYVSPDLSFHDGTGTLPDEELDWHEERNAAQEAEAKAVAENEDKVAKEEAKAAEEAAKEAEAAATSEAKTEAKTPAKGSS
jgi:hypothetical protein